jgi:hypothetical protein
MAERETKQRRSEDTLHPGQDRDVKTKDENRDPISGAPGAHPVGTGLGAVTGGAVGAAGGAAAGAAIGAASGSVVPGAGTLIGAAIGVVLGAIGGGYAGKGIAEVVDPTTEEAYWRSEYAMRPYYDPRYTYETDYAPAYGYGYATRYADTGGGAFSEAEPRLRKQWDSSRGGSRLDWEQARGPVEDAWDRYDELNAPNDEGAGNAEARDDRDDRNPQRRNPQD